MRMETSGDMVVLVLILHNLLRNQAEQPDENCEEENDFNELNEHCG